MLQCYQFWPRGNSAGTLARRMGGLKGERWGCGDWDGGSQLIDCGKDWLPAYGPDDRLEASRGDCFFAQALRIVLENFMPSVYNWVTCRFVNFSNGRKTDPRASPTSFLVLVFEDRIRSETQNKYTRMTHSNPILPPPSTVISDRNKC